LALLLLEREIFHLIENWIESKDWV